MKPFSVDGTGETEYILVDPWLLPRACQPALMQGALDRLLTDQACDPNQRQAVRSRSQVGFMLICLSRNDEALRMLQDCAQVQQSIRDYRGLVATLLRTAQAFQAVNDAASAVKVAQTALSTCTAEMAISDLQHFAQHHLGKAELQAGLYAEATRHLHIALASRQL